MLRVVVADDSAALRRRVVGLLEEMTGVEVIGEAADADAVVDLMPVLAPDVLVLDVRMPGGGGLEALRRIRGTKERPIVIMLTSFPSKQLQARCRELGADHVLDKTTRMAELVAIVRDLAEGAL